MKIAQSDNFTANFGDVLRSSAVFYCRQTKALSTTLSLLNYWPLKRQIAVALVVTVRDMAGQLQSRERLDFADAAVINYRLPADETTFEGTVEIEVFSTDNLVIPYAAVMAVYETQSSISMVHSYGRTYSRHEVEEGRTISIGEEACWTIRDTPDRRSFCVLHNGGAVQPPQVAILEVENDQGQEVRAEISFAALSPFEAVKLYPSDHLPDLAAFLNAELGQARISFRVAESFSRMLIGTEASNGDTVQVTHSNFNYRRHVTDLVPAEHATAWMWIPMWADRQQSVVVYPDSNPGQYEVSLGDELLPFRSGERLIVPLPPDCPNLVFRRLDGPLPTRIVTGLADLPAGTVLPFEVSLGVETPVRPPKRMWWGLCSGRTDHDSRLWILQMPEIYGPMKSDDAVQISLYSSHARKPLTTTIGGAAISRFAHGVVFEELFPSVCEYLHGDYGYYTVTGPYGGSLCYSSLALASGSATIEHGF